MWLKNRFRLIVRHLSKESSEEENRKIEILLEQDSDFKNQMNTIRQIWDAKETPVRVEDMDAKWLKMKQKMISSSTARKKGPVQLPKISIPRLVPSFSKFRPQYAFVIIFILICTAIIVKEYRQQIATKSGLDNTYKTIQVAHGKRITVTMDDGTEITLDAGSELRYQSAFKDIRELYLKGEGYFDVAKNPNRPFILHANNAQVRVLGTRFNVRAWEEVPIVTVTVLEGKVELSSKNEVVDDSVILTKGKQSKVVQDGKVLLPMDVIPEDFTCWMHNDLQFHNAPLKEILAQLERWYNYQFELEDPNIENRHMTIHLEHSKVNEAIELIGIIANVKIVQNGEYIRFETMK